MIKLVIRLAIVALVANGTWRLGSAYVSHYKFHDSIQQMTQYRGDESDDVIRGRIFELASELDIPVTDDALSIRRRDNHMIVDASYKRPVDLLPGYTYPWPFTIHVDTFVLQPQKFDKPAIQ